MASSVPEVCSKPVLVLGCGNVLFGDDGFGPAVAECLQARADLPDEICVVNAGTSAREILFDVILSEKRPEKIIVVDAVDRGLKPGELFRLAIEDLPVKKLDDFSMHQLPASNLLRELQDFCGVKLELIVCQVQEIPERVSPGLSLTVQKAVSDAVEMIIHELGSPSRNGLTQSPQPADFGRSTSER